MATIIAGRFASFGDAERATRGLFDRGFRREDVQILYVNPPGQHARTPVGGDTHADAGAQRSGGGARMGLVVGGLIGAFAGFMLAPGTQFGFVLVLILAGVGAWFGSLGGAMARARDARAIAHPQHPEHDVAPRDAGVLLAARVRDGVPEDEAVEVLERAGARDVERAQGEWREGQWVDFDPTRPPKRVHPSLQPGV